MKPALLLLVCLLQAPQPAQPVREDRTSCKPVTASFCQGLGYATTSHPSGVLGFQLQQVGQVVETGCSPQIAAVMCRVVVPECGSEEDSRKKPCRSLCERVKTECESTLRARRLSWPSRLRCESLPESNCVQVLQTRAVAPSIFSSNPKCEAITIPLCADLPYTETIMPNALGHKTQGEAGAAIQLLSPYVKVGCSPHLKPFLCSVYVPKCLSGARQPPCRTLCEQAKSGCASLMSAAGSAWPEALKCESYTTETCDKISDSPKPPAPTCQAITTHHCRDLRYSHTMMPGILGHKTQEEAAAEMAALSPLMQFGCSPHLRTFLCSAFFPKCVAGEVQKPCRTLCEKVRGSCELVLDRFGQKWPENLNCEAFTTESCEEYGVSRGGGICEPITTPMCQNLPYNQTILPNLLGHTSQRETATKMSFFNSLVKHMCPADIQVFLCRVYTPECVEGQVQQPCRALCEQAKRDCGDLILNFGVSWPDELQCHRFPQENCVSLQEEKPEKLQRAADVLLKLNAGGYTVRGKSLTLRTARLLFLLMDKDKSGDLDAVEIFKLEHHVSDLRREYVELYESRNPPVLTETQMKKAVAAHNFHLDEETFGALWSEFNSGSGVDYDQYVTSLTKLHILKDRFQVHQLKLPCDCHVASFSLNQFLKSAII